MTTGATSSVLQTVADNSSEFAVGNAEEFQLNLFLMGSIIYLGLAFVAVIGNGLVLYIAANNINLGHLQDMDDVIKSLAVADMLYGLLGVPSNLINNYYLSKYCVLGEWIIDIVYQLFLSLIVQKRNCIKHIVLLFSLQLLPSGKIHKFSIQSLTR
jgi:hypothetical protein